MKSENRKKLIEQYKNRKIVGGVTAVKNTVNSKMLIDASTDIKGAQNRFSFFKSTGSVVSMKIQEDWKRHGVDAFEFIILEELEKPEEQTMEEFAEDCYTLGGLWVEKFDREMLY